MAKNFQKRFKTITDRMLRLQTDIIKEKFALIDKISHERLLRKQAYTEEEFMKCDKEITKLNEEYEALQQQFTSLTAAIDNIEDYSEE